MTPIRILIVDSSPVSRSVLAALTSSHFGWQVCGEAADGEEAIEKARKLGPDVVVVDVDLPKVSGLEVLRHIAANHPLQRGIVLAKSDDIAAVRQIFDSGAHGFLLKANATRDLVPAIERVHSGRTFYSAKAAELVLQDCLKSGGSQQSHGNRQREVLNLLAKEFASAFAQTYNRTTRRRPRYGTFAAVAGAIALSLVMAYIYVPGVFDSLLQPLGLQAASTQRLSGNPEARVWIDLRTAQYYCPGEPRYGQAPNGRFARQTDALSDHFDPASRKACQ